MEKVSAVFLSEYKEDIIKKLQEHGVVEINEISGDLNNFFSANVSIDSGECLSLILRSEHLLKAFERMNEENFFESFFGKMKEEKLVLNKKQIETCLTDSKGFIELVEKRIADLKTRMDLSKKEIAEIETEIKDLNYFKELDFELSQLKNLNETFVFTGRVNLNFLAKLERDLSDFTTYLYKKPVENDTFAFVIGLNSEKDGVKNLLLKYGFEFFDIKFDGKPSVELERRKLRLELLEKKIVLLKRKESELYRKWYREIKKANLILNSQKERLKSLQFLRNTEYVSVLEGYVTEKHKSKVENVLNQASNGKIFIDFDKDTDAPIQLKNPGLVKKFEILTKSFGLPDYKKIDPTFFMALMFPIMFGIMIGDAIYGALLLAFSFALRYFFKNQTAEVFSKMLILCSISAIFWGVMFGSYFGDIFRIPPVWFDPAKNPMALIILSLSFGLIHVNIGITLSFLQNIKSHKSVLHEISSWFIEAGGVILLARFFKAIPPTSFLIYPAAGLLIIGVIMKLHPFKIMDIISLSGRIVSYVRIAALALASIYIALIVNKMTLFSLNISIILAGAIFIAGHLFGCVLSCVFSFITAVRLHYVEFFSQFFEGTGREFKPLRYTGLEIVD